MWCILAYALLLPKGCDSVGCFFLLLLLLFLLLLLLPLLLVVFSLFPCAKNSKKMGEKVILLKFDNQG